MKTITITVNVDGNEITRSYGQNDWENDEYQDWGERIKDMLDTIQHSKDNKF